MRAFLRRHGFHPVEALLIVVGALLPIYKLITLAVPAPTLPPVHPALHSNDSLGTIFLDLLGRHRSA